mgnify:CR=1 FL=1
MNILKYICLPGLLASGDIQTVSAVESKTDKNPNILVILIDDAGYNDFGFMGSKEMQTPNIDALTSEGVVFTDAHVAATVSSPSRACLITGVMDIGSAMNVTYRTVLMAFLWKKKRLRKYLKRMDIVLLLLVSGIWEVGMNNILIIVDLICFTV